MVLTLSMNTESLGRCRSSAFSLAATTSAYTNVIAREMPVASAAPWRPSAGIGPQPKMSIGSRMPLMMADRIMTLRAAMASPWARSTPLSIIGTMRKSEDAYHTSMYARRSGSRSAGAPSSVNTGSMVRAPAVEITATTHSPR